MDGLSAAGSIIAVIELTGKVVSYLNHIKHAPKDRERCAIEASNVSNLLLNLRYRLEEGQSDELWYTAIRALAVQNGPLDQYKNTLEELASKVTDGGRLKTIGHALVWKFSKEEATEIISRIERLKSLVQIALEMDHFKLSRAIKTDTSVIRDLTIAIKRGIDTLQKEQVDKIHDELMEWISSSNFPTQQSDNIARKTSGTGQWFLESSLFTDWITDSKATLFCPGIPGAGKTMIAAITIDHLSKKLQNTEIGLTYIYCSYKMQVDQTATALLAAILKQLLQAQPLLAEPLQKLYEHHIKRKTRLSQDEILSTLRTVLNKFSTVYIVVDALDECSDRDNTRRQFLSQLSVLQKTSDLHLMFTSRPLPEIPSLFPHVSELEVLADKTDIKQFVAGEIAGLECITDDDDLQLLIQEKIANAVDGMFLLARLHIDSLFDQDTKKKVKSKLETLSRHAKGSGLIRQVYDQAYDEAITRIKDQPDGRRNRAKQVLSWIVCAQRPLTTQELCHALAVEHDKKELDLDNLPGLKAIVSICAGLVTIDKETGIVRLVHYTTQDYLKRILQRWNPRAELEIALTCLTYLCFDAFASGSCPDDKDFEDRIEQHAFLDYAARYWDRHTKPVQRETMELALAFLTCHNRVLCALQTSSISDYRYHGYSQEHLHQADGVHMVARSGLVHVIEVLLAQNNVKADAKDDYGRTPLSWAAENGDEAVARLLAARDDVDVNTKDKYGRTPLWWAAANRHEAVARLLAARDDVDVNAKDKYGRTPLWWAARYGHEAVMRLLMAWDDVDVNAKDNYGQTPLWWAARYGHEAVARLLAARDDVDVNAKDDSGRTPLSWAAGNGYEAVARLLAARDDVDVNAKDDSGRTPLSRAAGNGHEAVVRLLTARDDVDVNSKDDDYGQTPLSRAAGNGHEAVVRLLAARDDVDVNTKDKYGGTPLSWAAENGDEAVVRLLAARDNVDVNTKDKSGRTPLSRAAENKDEAVVRLLAARDDVDVNTKDNYGQTPLWWAARYGHEAVARLLAARDDVDVNVKDHRCGRTPLSWAAANGHEAVVRLLTARDDVDVDAEDHRCGRTPLSWAAANGHEAVVRLLDKRRG